jgi:hypothetical protein
MRYLIVIIAIMVSFPAFAQTSYEPNPSVCGVLSTQKYQGNVDAYGRAVAPADLNSSDVNIVPDVIKVPLTVDFAKRFSGLSGSGIQLEAPLGMMEVSSDGSVTYNGQNLTDQVKTLCGIPHVIKTEVTVAPTGDGILNQKKIINDVQVVNDGVAVEAPVAQEVLKQAPVSRAAVSKPEPEAEIIVEQANVIEPEMMPANPAPRVETTAVGGVRVKTEEELNKQLSEKIEGGDYRDYNLNE